MSNHLLCRYCPWTGYQLRALIIHFRLVHSIQGDHITLVKKETT